MVDLRYMNREHVHILLVEDDDIDAELVLRAYRRHSLANPFTIVRDGVEALEVLRGSARTERLPRPYLILLDINMPRMNGIEFLHEVRHDSDLRRSIVFVLTTSNNDEDKLAAYNEQIAGYLLKANVGEDFCNVIALLDSYRNAVEFPPENC
jgi:CheY-like chemotaxis protein